jgi:hypothetical protein
VGFGDSPLPIGNPRQSRGGGGSNDAELFSLFKGPFASHLDGASDSVEASDKYSDRHSESVAESDEDDENKDLPGPFRSLSTNTTSTNVTLRRAGSQIDQQPREQHANVNVLSLEKIFSSSERNEGPLWERMLLDAIPEIGTLRTGHRTIAIPSCMVAPDSIPRMSWDFVCLLIIGIETFLVPFSHAFSGATIPTYWVWFVVAFFAADIVLNFFTGFQYRGIVVRSLQLSAVKYTTSVWIWVDVVSTIPWDVIEQLAATGSESDVAHSDAMRLLRLLRIGKLMRLAKLGAIVPRIEAALQQSHNLLVGFKLSKFLGVLLVFIHLQACCWGALGEMDWNQEVEFHAPWMQHTVVDSGVAISDLALSRRYSFSLAWSSAVLLQGAYAPPYNPGTFAEHIFLCVAHLLSFYICALFVGSLVAMLDDLYTVKRYLKADQSPRGYFSEQQKV